MAFRRRCRLMHRRRGWRRRLMHDRWRRWRRGLMLHRRRLRRRRIHIVLDLPLRCRRESLRQRIVLPLCRRWRTFIVSTPYLFGLSLMVVPPTIKITSTIASVPSGLLIDYSGIAVALDSPVIVIDVRLWLRWRIVCAWHSRHIVIRVYVPAASVSIGTA